ncbi:hypothetical protein SLA2020_115490 [Shorea laevis]
MDSANSGSMQSSSGGDEEYDSSRPDHNSVPAFLNHLNPMSNFHHQPTFFDPSPNFLNPFSQPQPSPNPNPSLLNLDVVRAGTLRSEPNHTDATRPGLSSFTQSALAASQPDRITAPVKNPKKRTRASRRAPTTVLTTDTSNFRAMVQEFTGIPSPPFSGSAYSRRLDLFSTAGAAMRSAHLDPLAGSLYPLCPLAQRVQVPPTPPPLLHNVPTSGSVDATTTNQNIMSTTNLLNIPAVGQNSVLSLQSLLQPPQLLPLPHLHANVADFGVKSQAGSSMASLEDLGLRQGHVNANFGQNQIRPLDGNYSSLQRASSCKVNYSSASSTSEFHHHLHKGLENVSSRADQGTVDPWICPSDNLEL